MARRLTFEDPGFFAAFATLVEERRETSPAVEDTVTQIIAAVRREGLPALLRISRQLDAARLEEADLRVSAEEIAAGAEGILSATSQVLAGVNQIATAAEEAGAAAAQAATAAREQSRGAEDLAAAIEEIALLAGELQATKA